MKSREVLGTEFVPLKEPDSALENCVRWQNCFKDTDLNPVRQDNASQAEFPFYQQYHQSTYTKKEL